VIEALEAAGVHYRQWRTLTKTALTIDVRALFMAGRKSTLELRLAGMALRYAVVVVLIAGTIAAPIWLVPDPAWAAAAALTAIMELAALIGLSEQGSTILSAGDASIVGCRPVSSRTLFAARLTSLLLYGTVQITAFASLAVLSFAIRHPPAAAGAFVIAVYGAATLTLLGCVLGKLTLLAGLRPSSVTRALAWAHFLVSLPFIALAPLTFYLVDGVDWHALRLPGGWPGLAYPPAWFAAFVQVAGARATSGQRIAALMPLALAAATVSGIAILSRGYLERLMALDASSAPARNRGRSDPGRWFRGHETRAIVILMRGQLRSDAAFRSGVISAIAMSLLMPVLMLWGMGRDRTLFGSTAGLLVGIPVVNSMALLRSLSLSPSWPASWVLFGSPASQFRIVRAALRLLWSVAAVPTMVLIYALMSLWGFSGARTIGQFVIIGMAAYTAMLVDALVSPALPLSRQPQGSGAVHGLVPFLPAMVMGASAIVINLAAWHVVLLAILMPIFGGAMLGLERLLRLRLERRPLLMEGED
jgi:hypothetical protein